MRQGMQIRPVAPAVPFPIIVVILGPATYASRIAELAVELELAGRIPVVTHVRPSSDLPDVESWNAFYQVRLRDLTLRKIDMADEVLVVGLDDELGETVAGQMTYARSLRKPVRRMYGR